jgi:hypothetical protein
MFTGVSEEPAATIFTLYFPDKSSSVLRIQSIPKMLGDDLPDYTASHPRIQ